MKLHSRFASLAVPLLLLTCATGAWAADLRREVTTEIFAARRALAVELEQLRPVLGTERTARLLWHAEGATTPSQLQDVATEVAEVLSAATLDSTLPLRGLSGVSSDGRLIAPGNGPASPDLRRAQGGRGQLSFSLGRGAFLPSPNGG